MRERVRKELQLWEGGTSHWRARIAPETGVFSDADADVTILKEANAEYAKLR